MRTLAVLAAATLALAACAGASGAAPPAASERDAAKLYRSRCASCHRLHEPSEYTREAWRSNLDRMQGRAHLGAAERAEIERYLDAHAKDAQPAS